MRNGRNAPRRVFQKVLRKDIAMMRRKQNKKEKRRHNTKI